ncbi:MAG: hypothetical protein ABC378_08805 [Staphylococcus pseudoxylosus]|uniref:hypothetical protein n=1 Tax=Staphylococcus pseudoxylosus TaxID=2282419 RepID=UPI002DBA2B66|nr:hypothetical protein [Staphylococcus pseudoxylosus]MEB6061539.1 hypothetical protein [Staphylococcus pseudoxylosus]MEB7753233.1 hypothetical protein [Staphylococcus pseudoxylosus]
MEIVDFSYDHENYTYIVKTMSGVLFSHSVHKDMPPNKVTSELLQRERHIEQQ